MSAKRSKEAIPHFYFLTDCFSLLQTASDHIGHQKGEMVAQVLALFKKKAERVGEVLQKGTLREAEEAVALGGLLIAASQTAVDCTALAWAGELLCG